LRREKDIGREIERIVTCRKEGRTLHTEITRAAKDLVWAIVALTCGPKREIY